MRIAIDFANDTAIDSTSGGSGVKTPFSENSLMKGEHETFFRKCPTNATNATFERETDSNAATDDDSCMNLNSLPIFGASADVNDTHAQQLMLSPNS
jgi:hypothetical protein